MLEMLIRAESRKHYVLPTFTGPGPQEPLFTIEDHMGLMAFYGEVPTGELINGPGLATLIGLTAGTSINPEEPWLKFVLDDKVLFVGKKPFKHSLSWNQIDNSNAVYGNRIEKVVDLEYSVRLLKGADTDPTPLNVNGNYLNGTHNSEWSRLFYPLIKDDSTIPIETRNSDAPYTLDSLGMLSGSGRRCWCQETIGAIPTYRVVRGNTNATIFIRNIVDAINDSFLGWRPVLELVSTAPVLYPPEEIFHLTSYMKNPRVTDWYFKD